MPRCLHGLAVLPMLWACASTMPPAQRASNFDLCLHAQRACQSERLDARQREIIEQRAADAHLDDCMQRRRCNESLLDHTQRQQVKASVARLNYAACLRGDADCDARLLDPMQEAAVAEAATRRNFELCLGGLTLCDASRLSAVESIQVREAYLARNFSGCMNTVGTLVECNPDDLLPAQRDAVLQRAVAVNYFLCANNAFGCDRTRLTPEERERLGTGGALLH